LTTEAEMVYFPLSGVAKISEGVTRRDSWRRSVVVAIHRDNNFPTEIIEKHLYTTQDYIRHKGLCQKRDLT